MAYEHWIVKDKPERAFFNASQQLNGESAVTERILWYSREFQDWNINAGLEAKPVGLPGTSLSWALPTAVDSPYAHQL